MIKLIEEYFSISSEYSILRFVFEMYIISMVLKILIIVFSMILIGIFETFDGFLFGGEDESETSHSQFMGLTWLQALLIICIITPFVESIVFQGIPIWILSKYTNKTLFIIVLSALIFTYFHTSIISGFVYFFIILSAGLIYSWSFYVYLERSFWIGILVTSAIHFLYNFTVFITVYLF